MALNQDIFLQRSKEKHGDRYNYDKSIYTKFYNKVIITCKTHGEFIQVASDHMAGCGCPSCKIDTLKKCCTGNSYCKGKYKYTLDTFIEKANLVHNNFYDYTCNSELSSVLDKIDIICPIHGVFTQKATEHLSGYGCRQCGVSRIGEDKRKFKDLAATIQEFNLIHNNKFSYANTVLTPKTRSIDKVEIICPIHGSFYQSLRLHRKGHGCKRCSQQCTKKTPKGIHENVPTNIYLLRLSNNDEMFYKFGITIRPVVERIVSIPYTIEILDILKTTALYAYAWEHLLLTDHKMYKYHPKIPFGGQGECIFHVQDLSIRNLLSQQHTEISEYILEEESE